MSTAAGSDAQKKKPFRQTLLALNRRLALLVSLPPEKLERTMLQGTARGLVGS